MEKIKKQFNYYFILLFFAVVFLVWYAVFAESRGGELTVAFLDVGQGDAILVDSPTGHQVLIDGGQNKKVLQELSKVMPFYDRSIDVVLATHPDSDHIGGLPDVLERYDVDLVIEPGVVSDSAEYQVFDEAVKNEGAKRIFARRGMKINLGEDVYILILFPNIDVDGWDANDASIVAKLVYGDTSYLLTGDSPQKIEKYLVSLDKKNLDVDVLKVGHHGSKTSTSEVLIGFTSPEYAIISSEKDNRYGHPHQEVLDILNKFEIKILRIDETGTVTIKSDGENILLK